jgi:Cu-Zn family superoxide dismutase
VIVHADPDDYGKGGEEDSLTTGHAGARIACAIIGRLKGCT